jgi:hypothetical protein
VQKTQTAKTLLDAARSVMGIEVSDTPASESSRPILSFYPDQSEALIATLKKSRRDEVLVCETAEGDRVGIYRRPRK